LTIESEIGKKERDMVIDFCRDRIEVIQTEEFIHPSEECSERHIRNLSRISAYNDVINWLQSEYHKSRELVRDQQDFKEYSRSREKR